jgi:signal peptidase I
MTDKSDKDVVTKVRKSRNILLAMIFAWFIPGLGHIYVGRAKKGIVFLATAFGIYIIVGLSGLMTTRASVVLMPLMYALMFGVLIYLFIDAGRLAHRYQKKGYEFHPKKYNRWYVYVAYLIVVGMLISFLGTNRQDLLGYDTFRIPSGSTLPNLWIGDYITVDTRNRRVDNVERGDLIVFDYPHDRSVKFLKRVVGISGDTISYINKQIFINGVVANYQKVSSKQNNNVMEFVEELDGTSYRILNDQSVESRDVSSVSVPDGQFFVLGDNRDHSNDSRYWGFVPRDHLRGVPAYVWFSWENFSRIGIPVQ